MAQTERTNFGGLLDSALAYLSIEARKILDEHGFKDAKTVASNELAKYHRES